MFHMRKKIGTYALRLLAATLCFCLLTGGALADAVNGEIVTLGTDLSPSQKETVLSLLGVKEDEVEITTITIAEEKALLGDWVPAKQIGSRSLSSACVTMADEGNGIKVTTHNITWVTSEMITSALATAGVSDAVVIVAAPFDVSGTAALAGIFKAYETAGNIKLDDAAKDAAGQEIARMGQLGETIGQDEAATLIAQVKQAIVEQGLDQPETIKPVIEQTAKQYNITLTDTQMQQLVDLMMTISKLDLNPQKISDQLASIADKLAQLEKVQEKTSGMLAKLSEAFGNFINWIKGLFGK